MPETRDSFSLNRSQLSQLWRIVCRADKSDQVQLLAEWEASWRLEARSVLGRAPDLMDKKMSEGEEAFTLFRRILKMLELPERVYQPIDALEDAHSKFREKKYGEAFNAFQRGIVNCKPSIDDLCVAGTAALHCNQLDYVNEYADQALLKNSLEVKALMLKGIVLYRREDYKNALPYFEKAARLEPDSQTAIRYFKKTEEQIELKNKTMDQKMENRGNVLSKRRWIRKPVNFDILVNDFSDLSAMNCKVRSLSAGGGLIEGPQLPNEFDFYLDLGRYGKIRGSARKVYQAGDRRTGVRFVNLTPGDEDLINQHIVSGRC